jgi:hypothetical protein
MNARDALRLLEQQYGHLTAELVVEAARPEDSDLHPYIFDRTPEAAAEAWWLHRAQELIQSIRVRYEKSDGQIEVRRYVSVVDERYGRVYKDAEEVVQDPITRELVLREMRRDVAAMQQRYQNFTEFWQLIEALAQASTIIES